MLKNIPAMIAYCLNNQESRIIQSPEYLFRVDAGYHAYLLRCTPSELLDNAYIYAYRRDLLERHMKKPKRHPLCHHGRQREIQGVGWGADPHYHRRRWHP